MFKKRKVGPRFRGYKVQNVMERIPELVNLATKIKAAADGMVKIRKHNWKAEEVSEDCEAGCGYRDSIAQDQGGS